MNTIFRGIYLTLRQALDSEAIDGKTSRIQHYY